ncbi:MAG TPA: hypothetical protein VFI49_01930 [Rudaea sp.]|nr:hypothetical protein [Rudaea sp.]
MVVHSRRNALLLIVFAWTVPATASDIVVVRVGVGGATALDSAASPVFLERYTGDGTNLGTIALPTAVSGANQPFVLSGTASSEGAIAVSADGNYLTLAGYAAAQGIAAISTTTSASVNRVVARIDALFNIDTSSRLNAAFNAANVRAAASADGNAFWVSGNAANTSGGVWYLPFGTTGGTQIVSTPNNARVVNIFSGQIYADSNSSTFANVFSIGSGLPVTAGQTVTSFPGMPASGASPFAFALFDRSPAVSGIDTLYVADDRSIASGGGIQKWLFDGVNWTLSTTFTNGLSVGVRGLAGEAVGANIVLYATTADNNLVRLVDDGSVSPLAAVIATAATNTAYRGVALAWVAPVTDVIFKDGFD